MVPNTASLFILLKGFSLESSRGKKISRMRIVILNTASINKSVPGYIWLGGRVFSKSLKAKITVAIIIERHTMIESVRNFTRLSSFYNTNSFFFLSFLFCIIIGVAMLKIQKAIKTIDIGLVKKTFINEPFA